MRNQAMPVHQELVAFGFTAENRMVVENKTCLAFSALLLKDQRRRQTADASAYDDAIIGFACVDDARGKALKQTIANLVASFKNSVVLPLEFA